MCPKQSKRFLSQQIEEWITDKLIVGSSRFSVELTIIYLNSLYCFSRNRESTPLVGFKVLLDQSLIKPSYFKPFLNLQSFIFIFLKPLSLVHIKGLYIFPLCLIMVTCLFNEHAHARRTTTFNTGKVNVLDFDT